MAVVTPSACRRVRLSFAALDDEGERDDDGARDERRDRSLLVAPRPLGLGQPLAALVRLPADAPGEWCGCEIAVGALGALCVFDAGSESDARVRARFELCLLYTSPSPRD